MVAFGGIPYLDVETFAAWAAVLVVKAAATVGTVGEAQSHAVMKSRMALGLPNPEKSQQMLGSSSSSDPEGP
jgi:hypothetical protein